MFGNANKKARKTAMKAFKRDRRDIFEGLSDEGRGKVVDALQTRLRELKGRGESDISRQFRNSPFVRQKVQQFANIIDDKRQEMERKASRSLQRHIDSEMDRYNEAKRQTDEQEALIKEYKREITNLERDIANQKKKQQSAIAKKKKLRQAAKKLNDRLGVIAASKALDAAQQAKRAKDKLKQVKAQIKEAQAQEKAATNSVRRLENEQRRVRMEIGAEQQALEDFRDELDVRDEANYEEETRLRISNLNQMVYLSRKQTQNVLEQIMFSHPVSVKGPRANLIARGTTYEGYALLCENTADVMQMNVTIIQGMKQTGLFMDEGVEVFAFAESAEEYMTSMVDLMQDLTEKANRAATALRGIGRGIKVSPYQEVVFALAVRDHYETMQEESRDVARLMGVILPVEQDTFAKSRVAKFIANAEDKSGTTTDGLLERIANAEQADAMGSVELTWDKDTNEQYNALIGEIDIETAEAVLDRPRNIGREMLFDKIMPKAPMDISSASELLKKRGERLVRDAKLEARGRIIRSDSSMDRAGVRATRPGRNRKRKKR